MAVVGSAVICQDGWDANLSETKHSITIKYLVKTNDYADGPLTVLLANGLPVIGATYATGNDTHAYAVCRSFGKATRVAPNSLHWHVDVEFSTPEPTRDSPTSGGRTETAGSQDNPTLELPSLEMRTVETEEAVFGVYNTGTNTFEPCQATTGEVFDPPPVKKTAIVEMTFGKNELVTLNVQALIVLYQDSVNSDIFFGFPIGSVRCTGITAKKETKILQNGTQFSYLRVTYNFAVKGPTVAGTQGWDTNLLNQGSYYILGGKSMLLGADKPKKRKFLTDEGHPCQGALKQDGDRLPEGDSPVFLKYRFYQRAAFAGLGLPSSFAGVA